MFLQDEMILLFLLTKTHTPRAAESLGNKYETSALTDSFVTIIVGPLALRQFVPQRDACLDYVDYQ